MLTKQLLSTYTDSFLPVQCSGTQAIISGVSITRVRDWPSRLFSRMYVHLYLVRVNTFTFPTYYYDYDLPCEQPWLALSARLNQFMQTQFAGGQRFETERRCGVVYCVFV